MTLFRLGLRLSNLTHTTTHFIYDWPKSIMKLQTTVICKPRARLRSNSHQRIPGSLYKTSSLMTMKVLTLDLETRRRSSRLQSSQHTLGSYYESQNPLEQLPAETRTSQPVRAIANPRVPALGPIEQSELVPLRAQVQGWLCY